jgi:hypothetical protein
MFRRETSIALAPVAGRNREAFPEHAPLAHLTGTVAYHADAAANQSAARLSSRAGGVLLIDAAGAPNHSRQHPRRPFPAADAQPAPLKLDHPLLAGRGPGMTPLLKQQVRPFVFKAFGSKVPPIAALNVGKGAVLVSDLDLTSGLLGTNTLGIIGYDPPYAHAFVRNTILWTINGADRDAVERSTRKRTTTTRPPRRHRETPRRRPNSLFPVLRGWGEGERVHVNRVDFRGACDNRTVATPTSPSPRPPRSTRSGVTHHAHELA